MARRALFTCSTAAGSTLNALRDTGDHALILLALSAVGKRTGEAQVRHEIGALTGFLDSHPRSAYGLVRRGNCPARLEAARDLGLSVSLISAGEFAIYKFIPTELCSADPPNLDHDDF
jgi:hypothetical protein